MPYNLKFLKKNLGLFVACNLHKTIFSIYLDHVVNVNDISYQYIMELLMKFVGKSKCVNKWQRIRNGRKPIFLDAIMLDEQDKFKVKKELHLRAHTINDPNFGNDTIGIQLNCVIHRLLNVIMLVNVKAGKASLINYNSVK